MVQFGGDINFPSWSGLIESLQNSLTLKATTSGDIIISQDNNLLPQTNASQNLGRTDLLWNDLFSVNGTFTNRPTVNGTNVALTTELAGQTSIEGLSGVIDLDTTNNSIAIGTTGQTINLDAIFTWASGQLVESIVNSSGVQALNGVSGLVDLTSPNGTILINVNGQTIELTALSNNGQTSVNGISGALTLTSPDESININVDGQNIEVSTPGSGALSGASYLLRNYNDNGHLTNARILSATSGITLDDKGVRSVSGLIVKLDFDNEPQGILEQELSWNGSKLEWTQRVRKVRENFTPSSGLEFVVYHGLNTVDWTWNMWRNVEGGLLDILIPDNIQPSGVDHAIINFTSSDASPSGYHGNVIFVG